MWGWFTRRREAREEADRLVAEYGADAWDVAHWQSRERGMTDAERAQAYRVRRLVAKRLGITARVDTGTRYLGR